MNLYLDSLKNPYVIVVIVLIIIVVGSISYLDDKANKNNKKSFLGHCKLIMICLLSALIMLFGYIFIDKSSFSLNSIVGGTTPLLPETNAPLVFSEEILKGDPGF